MKIKSALLPACVLVMVCVVALVGCGEKDDEGILNHAGLDHEHCIHELTKAEVTQVEAELTAVLEVGGVKLIEEENRDLAVAVTVERGKTDYDPGTVTYQIYDLEEGYPDKKTKPIQEIVIEDYYFHDDAPCHVDDYNFDGWNDFYLWLQAGAQNAQGRFFLWDPESGQFVENEALGQLTSPMARKEFKIVLEHIHVSGAEYVDLLYRWEEGGLVPVRRILQEMPDYGALQGQVHDWYEGGWELMYERKILLSEGDWTEEDQKKIEDLSEELNVFYDPQYYGF